MKEVLGELDHNIGLLRMHNSGMRNQLNAIFGYVDDTEEIVGPHDEPSSVIEQLLVSMARLREEQATYAKLVDRITTRLGF